MRKFRSILLILLLSLLFTGCNNKKNRITLSSWKYFNGQEFTPDGNFFYHRLKIYKLHELASITPDHQGFMTITSTFKIPQEMRYMDLSLYLGKLTIAGKVFVNGHELETVGTLPPNAFFSGNVSHAINIPREFLNEQSINKVDIIIWVDGTGGIEGIPFIGTVDDAKRTAKVSTFFMSELPLLLSTVLFLIAIYYFMLFFVQRKKQEYLFFGLMNLTSCLYLVPFFVGEFTWLMGLTSMLRFRIIFEAIGGLVTSFFVASFFLASLGITIKKRAASGRIICLLVPLAFYLSTKSMVSYCKNIVLIYFGIAAQVLYIVFAIMKFWKEKRREIFRLVLPFTPTFITIGLDLYFKTAKPTLYLPYFTAYGWVTTSIVFLAVLSKTYASMQMEMDRLNSHLEQEVNLRTMELEKANQELAYKNHQSEQDLDLAVHMQQEFYKGNHDFFGWDIAVHFQPLMGVSGDLYDFYALEGILRGVGLFDVSGHGISSGLVTMLAKNAIFHEFRASLPLDLSQAIEKVNDAIIRVKGEIENYMTGILCRLDKEDNEKIEMVNAGCPYPILYHANTGDAEYLTPDSSKPQYGMLGVKGFPLKCQTINFRIQEEDFLVLYTDGLIESCNRDGQDYGKERVLESIKRAKGSAQDILENITNDLMLFMDGARMDDDLTIVILKRAKKFEDDISDLEEL